MTEKAIFDAFDDYQDLAKSTAIYPGKNTLAGLTYVVLGLAGEAGEVAEKMKKLLRDKGGVVDGEFKEALLKEISDVLWYLSMIAEELKFPFRRVPEVNIAKLAKRKQEGKLQGSGDNR